VTSAKLEGSSLLAAMLADLERSGISRNDAIRMRVSPLSADTARSLTAEGIFDPCYRIPYFKLDGSVDPLFFRLRRLPPGPAAMDYRYWQPKDSISRLYMPPLLGKGLTWAKVAKDTKTPIYITEGEKKSAKGCLMGIACAGLGGVWNFKSKKAILTLIRDLRDIDWKTREAVIVYDAEVAGRASLQGALHALARELTNLGAKVFQKELPPELNRKVGLDDYLIENGIVEFAALEKKAFDINAELWAFNERYSLLKKPTAILRFEDDELLSEKNFRLQERSRSIVGTDAAGRPKEMEAAAQWLKWPMRARTTKLVYQPRAFGAPREIGDGSHNLWKGWGATAPVRDDAAVKLFARLLDHLCGDAEPFMRVWVEQLLAYPIQNPGAKLQTAVLIHGPQGAGKTTLGYAMREVYGAGNFSEIKREHLQDPFNTWLLHKQFILADEITSTHKLAEMNNIKGYITQAKVMINRKYIEPYTLDDVANYLFVSNSTVPLSLEEDDRRFGVIHVKARIADDLRKAFGAMYKSERGRNAIAWHLLNGVDCASFDPYADAPMSKAKSELIVHSRSDIAAFVVSCIESYDYVFALSGLPIECDFQTADLIAARYNAKHANDSQRTSGIHVGRILAKHDESGRIHKFPQVVSERDGKVRLYAFRNVEKWRKCKDLQKVIEHWDAVSPKTKAAEVYDIDAERNKRQLRKHRK
jgi:hypothetical protein